jgi:protein phosphatase 2C family protein 2/3
MPTESNLEERGVFVFSGDHDASSHVPVMTSTTEANDMKPCIPKWDVGVTVIQNKRNSQEDVAVVVNDTAAITGNTDICQGRGSFVAVYDGHGGDSVSTFLSRNLHKNYLAELASADIPAVAFTTAYTKTDAYLADRDLPFTGSTAVTCHLVADKNSETDVNVHCANAGDSFAVLASRPRSSSHGDLSSASEWFFRKLSEEHRPTNRLEEIRVKSAGGKVAAGRVNGMLAVSRAFGDFFFKKNGPVVTAAPYTISTKIDTVVDESYLILGSDGVRCCSLSNSASEMAN